MSKQDLIQSFKFFRTSHAGLFREDTEKMFEALETFLLNDSPVGTLQKKSFIKTHKRRVEEILRQ